MKKKEIEILKSRNLIVKVVLVCIIILLSFMLVLQKMTLSKEILYNPYDIKTADMDNFVLLGDSITAGYPVEEFFDDLPVVNSGVNGYTTTDILDHLEEMVSVYNPTKVFLLIGVNDIRGNVDIKKVVDNISKIINQIKKLRPSAKIYLESIYPINDTDQDSIDHDAVAGRKNSDIQSINKQLAKKYKDSDVTYIDVYKELADKDGNLQLKYTQEGVHMSSLGYLKVTKVLLPYFQD